MAIALKGVNKSNVASVLARNYKLVPHLNRAIADGEFEWDAKFEPKLGDDAWHPSGDCTPSMHELWLKATGQLEHRPFSVGLRKTFAVGHFWHAYLQWVVVEKLGFAGWDDIERRGTRGWGHTSVGTVREVPSVGQVPWAPYHWATGSADVCPCEIPGSGSFLIDFKTMNGNDFRKPDPPDWTADKWECQANIYMDWFDVEQAIFVGIQKDSPHEFKEFHFKRNQALIDAIYLKWKIVSECLAEGIEVPEDEDVDLPIKGHVKT